MHVITILRDYLGINQIELAQQANVTQADLSEIESHPYGSIEKYKRLSKVLGIPVHTLVTNDFTGVPMSFFEAHPHRPYRNTTSSKDKRYIIGRGGEEAAFRMEQVRTAKITPALAHMVLPYYKFRSNSPGYDILSYDSNGKPILIEVKTTENEPETEFTLTRHEYSVARKMTARGIPYHIYRYSRFGQPDQQLDILDFSTMTPLQIYPSEYTCSTAPKANKITGITYYRQLRGLTQIQLAEQMGISPHHISRYEKGEREPKATTYQKIAELLEVSIDDLLATYPVSAYEQ